MTADDIIAKLGLEPHPEGGWYRQTWAGPDRDGRPEGTCIYFLLKRGEASHWHRVDASEMWLFHGGQPLEVLISHDDTGPAIVHSLGLDLMAGQTPQVEVPKHAWQATRPVPGPGPDWSLVSCTVVPGFLFDGFTLADPGFDIPT